jgi:protein-disulfide isomerase
VVIEYADLECPHCARAHLVLRELPVTRVFRHFPVASKHPRARMLAAAAEAAGEQGRFWEMHDSLLEDQGHLDLPHLWARARRLGLDVERFDEDRRSERLAARVERDFRSGIRAGVVTTPTQFAGGRAYPGVPGADLTGGLGIGAPARAGGAASIGPVQERTETDAVANRRRLKGTR